MNLWMVALLLAPEPAGAAPCDALAAKAAQLKGEQVASTFRELAACDKALAEEHFPDFMRASTDVGTLVELSLTAVDAQIYRPVWGMLEKVPDYAARAEVAKGVGAHCTESEQVLPFLAGGYSALGDRQFNAWRDALTTCEAPALVSWLEQTVSSPPTITYDEKYNAVADALVKHKRAEALPALEQAAIAALDGGPLTTLLDRMADAARPAYGAQVDPAAQERLHASLSRVAETAPPPQARLVADRLYQSNAEGLAAALLPSIYPDRVQSNGSMLYGVAAVESCDRQAIVHYAPVTDPAKRWSILEAVQEPALSFKPRLKCQAEGAWPVLTTPEPLQSKADVEAWAEGIAKDWAARGLDARTRQEKPLALH